MHNGRMVLTRASLPEQRKPPWPQGGFVVFRT